MASKSNVYIAGVGYSSLPSDKSIDTTTTSSLVSAAVKAFLDAGVTYDDVSKGVRSKTLNRGDEIFALFNGKTASVTGVETGSELVQSYNLIRDQNAHCVLAITAEKSAATAFVLISDDFLWRRPYLKNSSALMHESEDQQSASKEQVKSSLYDICQSIWSLRGWSSQQSQTKAKGPLYYKGPKQTFELSRADGRNVPDWKDVEHQHDGKHRLGYNPANETRDISQEDFEAVKARGKTQDKATDSIQFKRRGGDRAAIELARL